MAPPYIPSLNLFVSKMGATGRSHIATGKMERMMESVEANAILALAKSRELLHGPLEAFVIGTYH